MPSSLSRVLRVRALQEELARMELETETARLREFEEIAAQAACEARSSRERWFVMVEGERGGQEASSLRIAEDDAWSMAVGRRAQAEARRPAQEARVERARAEFLAGRRDRKQVESLLAAAADIERLQRDRREQRRVDDWFQSRPRRNAEVRKGRSEAESAKETCRSSQF